MDREQFIEDRTNHHRVVITAAHAGEGIPEHAIEYWARQQAETDWRRTRVHDQPVEVAEGRVWTHDKHTDGVQLRFNPGGPMVSIMSLSYEELRELMVSGIKFLRAHDEWPNSDRVRELFERA